MRQHYTVTMTMDLAVDVRARLSIIDPRTSGELAVAEMAAGLDQPKMRLVLHLETAAGGSGFEV
jgi:hypothetical protein